MRFEISSGEVSKEEKIIYFIPSPLNSLMISYFASSLLGLVQLSKKEIIKIILS
jgi:hypothetical protein